MTDCIIKKIIFLSYRRRKLDKDLKKYSILFKGKVLDVGGGRQRGYFKIPLKKISKWIVLDIDKEKKPDIVGSVEKLPFRSNYFDTVKATEVFEHVDNFEAGITECVRVLKKDGYFIFSIPFLTPIHNDPHDYQRLTEEKIKTVLRKTKKAKIVKVEKEGYMLSVIADMIKGLIIRCPTIVRWFFWLLLTPLLELLIFMETYNFIAKNKYITKFPAGYFFVVRKK